MQFPPKKADLIIKEISENSPTSSNAFKKKPAQLVAHTKMVPNKSDTIFYFYSS